MRHLTEHEKATVDAFFDAVNMPMASLERWLATDESRAAADVAPGGPPELSGQRAGRRIVDLLHTKTSDYAADDFAHMRVVADTVQRLLAQRPDGDVHDTPWRHALMNWGHDPLAD